MKIYVVNNVLNKNNKKLFVLPFVASQEGGQMSSYKTKSSVRMLLEPYLNIFALDWRHLKHM